MVTPTEVAAAPMITITEPAAAKIQALMPSDTEATYALRMRVVGGGCSGLQYQLDFDNEKHAGDTLFMSNGVRVCIDAKSAQYLAGVTIDYADDLAQSGFQIRNPNAKTSCGCGQSFR